MFTFIEKIIFNKKLKQANAHYKTDFKVGEHCFIERENKEKVEVLLYFPKKRNSIPVFVWVHGGAWVGMDAVDDDASCKLISEKLNALVVNINYKRLYEKPFPYPQEEVSDVVKWLIKNSEELHIDKNKIVVSGGSAGGHIVAGAMTLLVKEDIKIAGMILDVPFLDFTNTITTDLGEIKKLIDKMLKIYKPLLPIDSDVISPAVCLSNDLIKKFPNTLIIVCGKDPLHIQGEYFFERLKKQKVRVELKKYENGYHGFNTDNALEKFEQIKIKEEYFEYKTNYIKLMFGE